MTYKVGEILKMSYANAYFTGLIVELWYDDHLDDTVVRIWRPEVGFQTWPLNGHYKIESMNIDSYSPIIIIPDNHTE